MTSFTVKCFQDLAHFGGERTVIVKINPRDVVSIPTDYNNSKGRTCRYEVIGEIDQDKHEEAFTSVVQENANNLVKPTSVPEQEYDEKGRPLSMTPNAIRKRAKRKAEKAAAGKA